MIEKIVRDYLSGALDGVPVFLELPEVPSSDYPEFPTRCVLIERVGGGRRNQIDSASMALQSYATDSLYHAAELDEQVRNAMENLATLPAIGGAHLASNYNFTDTRTKRYRYQSVYDITYKEV